MPGVLGRSPRTRRYYILLHGDPVRLLSMFKGSIHPLNISSLHVHGVPSPELSCLHVHRGFSRYSVSFGKPFGHGPFSLPSSGDGPGRRSLFLSPSVGSGFASFSLPLICAAMRSLRAPLPRLFFFCRLFLRRAWFMAFLSLLARPLLLARGRRFATGGASLVHRVRFVLGPLSPRPGGPFVSAASIRRHSPSARKPVSLVGVLAHPPHSSGRLPFSLVSPLRPVGVSRSPFLGRSLGSCGPRGPPWIRAAGHPHRPRSRWLGGLVHPPQSPGLLPLSPLSS